MIVFSLAIVCIIGLVKTIAEAELEERSFHSMKQGNYFESEEFAYESAHLTSMLRKLVAKYKSEEYILSGKAFDKKDRQAIEDDLYYGEYMDSEAYDYELSEQENKRMFKKQYAEAIKRAKENGIKEQVIEFHQINDELTAHKGIVYYAKDGEYEFSNGEEHNSAHFETYDAYILYEGYQRTVHPVEINHNNHFTYSGEELHPETDVLYLAYTEPYLGNKIETWEQNKKHVERLLKDLFIYVVGFTLSFVYLIVVIGRTSMKDMEIHLNVVDKLYNDINLALIILLPVVWVIAMVELLQKVYLIPTILIASVLLLLILSLIKHIKNRTIISHTLIYQVLKKAFLAVKYVFDSGSLAVKVVMVVIGYPFIVVATFFMFPITIGFAAWLALKKVKSFNRIQEGVATIKNGDIHHRIEVEGEGEFSQLATDINQITDGLKKSVDNEIKSERLKTELITNVSHDIRTPLTSIITFVDLLKMEKDPEKITEYIEVLDQKSERLKHLTNDLFEAAKASSGSMPVQVNRIDIVSLLTQAIGEMDEKIAASALDVKLAYPTEKAFMKADGKLLWRSIENLFSNIFKYAQPASRVYIDVEDLGDEIGVTFKNISAYELNITAEELMERFKRGDESRTSQGSGLGLSIAESLIHLQGGKFAVQVDGDLFKAMIYLPKFRKE